jgi:alpha-beta hydrolase superfamily lysophospholipase
MFRLLWLTKRVKGEFPILEIRERNGNTQVRLPHNPDTEADGLQSLFWSSRKGHCIVEPGQLDEGGRWFNVLSSFGVPLEMTKGAWLSGWLGERPEHFGIQSYEEVSLPNGTLGWQVRGDQKRWVIHVHGRKTMIGETLRNFPLFNELGFSQISISHATDPKPFGLGKRQSNLGATEWIQLEEAVDYVRAMGGTQIILFGWSLGGMIVGQYLKNSNSKSCIVGAIFDSPMFDVRNTLRLQAKISNYDEGFADEVCEHISTSRSLRMLGYPRLAVDELSLAKNPLNVSVPMLALYSSNDGYVEYRDALTFAQLNPTTMLAEIPGARHCRLRNSHVELYDSLLSDFVSKL